MSKDCVGLRDALSAVLTEAGEDPAGAEVYALVLTRGPLDEAAIAEVLEMTPDQVSALATRLIELGLLRLDHVDEQLCTAVALDGPVGQLLAAAEAGAATSIERVSRMRAATYDAARLLREIQTVAGKQPESQALESSSSVIDFLHTMNTECSAEVLTLVDHNPSPAALRQSRAQDQALLEKGIRIRSIYLSSSRSQPELMAYLRWLEEHGAQVAMAPVVPVRAMVFDNRTALIARNPDDLSAGALVMRSPGLVTAVTWLFELCWQQAEPIRSHSTGAAEHGLSAVELELLRHFARGRKDAAIARRMDVSVRTVRRTVTQLNERLDVSSRFELGAKAAEMGWITTGPMRSTGRST